MQSNLAEGLLEAGEDDQAATLLSEAYEGFRAVGDTYGIAGTLMSRATAALRRSDVDSAAVDLRESLRLSNSITDTQTIAAALAVAAAAVLARGDAYASASLCAADDAICTAHRFEFGPLERTVVAESMQAARSALGEEFEQAWAAGAKLDTGAAIELALSSLRP